jgi:hypothetical protein
VRFKNAKPRYCKRTEAVGRATATCTPVNCSDLFPLLKVRILKFITC